MYGDRDAKLVGGGEDAGICVGDIDYSVVEKLAGGFAVSQAGAHGDFCDLVEVFAGFRGHAEGSGTQTGFNVFGGVADESDFEIVDERGAVHGNGGDEAAAHELDEQGAEADFDYVATDAPENSFALLAGLVDGSEEAAEVGGGEEVGKRVEEFGERGIGGGRLGEIADADFALAGREGIGTQISQSYGASGVDTHGARSASRSSRFGGVPGA